MIGAAVVNKLPDFVAEHFGSGGALVMVCV